MLHLNVGMAGERFGSLQDLWNVRFHSGSIARSPHQIGTGVNVLDGVPVQLLCFIREGLSSPSSCLEEYSEASGIPW